MELDKKNQHQLKLCFSTRCNFCRRACPVYEVTGVEFDSPRARLELINEALERRIDTLDIISMLDRCTLCRKCIEVCPSRIEIPEIILDFKSKVRKEYVPEPAEIVKKNGKIDVDKEYIVKTSYPINFVKKFVLNGNPLNETPKKDEISGKLDFVFFPGCITNYKDKGVYDACTRFFKNIGSRYSVTNACCYGELKTFGFTKDEINRLFNKKHENLRGHTIVTPCAGCYHTLKEGHKLNVIHITELIHKNINKIERKSGERVSLHDPCKLGRYHHIYHQPREIIHRTGATLTELKQNRNDSHCCGGGGSLKYHHPEIQGKICENLLKLAEKETTIVTNCSYCKQNINEKTKQKTKHLVEII